MNSETIVLWIVGNIILATFFWWIHKTFEYKGSRGFLIGLTLFLPYIGALWFIVLSLMRIFGKKSMPSNDGKAQREEYQYFNTSSKYQKEFTILNKFALSQLMIFQITDKDLKKLLNDEEKVSMMLFFFGGAADYLTQKLGLDDEEAIGFIAFFIVLTLFNGDYKKMNYAKAMFMTGSLISDSDNYNLMIEGSDALRGLLSGAVDSTQHSLILKKLLSRPTQSPVPDSETTLDTLKDMSNSDLRQVYGKSSE